MRYKLFLSYNGFKFQGWQVQTLGSTVQGAIQTALKILIKEEVVLTGAGRTDTGVHSSRYFAHFETISPICLDTKLLLYKLNAILPKDIVIHNIFNIDNNFNARFSANKRKYKYLIHRNKNPFMGEFSYYYVYPINVQLMNEAAKYLIGEHNFSCFEKSGGNSNGANCIVYSAKWETYEPDSVKLLGFPGNEEDYIVFTIEANRFLRNMVRAIVGSLLEVGRGRKSVEWFKNLIDNGTRSDAGESVPGHALFLVDVKY